MWSGRSSVLSGTERDSRLRDCFNFPMRISRFRTENGRLELVLIIRKKLCCRMRSSSWYVVGRSAAAWMPAPSAGIPDEKVTEFKSGHALEKAKRFTACAGAEAVFCAPLWNIDDVHGPVTLAGNEQFVTAECHVHRLMTNLDRGLMPE